MRQFGEYLTGQTGKIRKLLKRKKSYRLHESNRLKIAHGVFLIQYIPPTFIHNIIFLPNNTILETQINYVKKTKILDVCFGSSHQESCYNDDYFGT